MLDRIHPKTQQKLKNRRILVEVAELIAPSLHVLPSQIVHAFVTDAGHRLYDAHCRCVDRHNETYHDDKISPVTDSDTFLQGVANKIHTYAECNFSHP